MEKFFKNKLLWKRRDVDKKREVKNRLPIYTETRNKKNQKKNKTKGLFINGGYKILNIFHNTVFYFLNPLS